MIAFQGIQKGLSIRIATTSKLGVDFVSITKKANEVEMHFQYSGMECVLIDPKNPIATHVIFRLANDYIHGLESSLYEHLPIVSQAELCCNTQVHLYELLKSKQKGLAYRLYIQSKLMQLLLCLIENPILQKSDCSTCKFLAKPYEREKIYKAREIILSSLHTSLTIPELAQRVGMNECYLKKGFKEIFDTTIFGFVQDQRMQRAKVLLHSAEMSVSEIAYEVGYANLSGFSAAFKKQVGVFPTEYVLQ